jgi:hypothetical protein
MLHDVIWYILTYFPEDITTHIISVKTLIVMSKIHFECNKSVLTHPVNLPGMFCLIIVSGEQLWCVCDTSINNTFTSWLIDGYIRRSK